MHKITANIFKLTFRTLSLLFILQFLTICLGTEKVFVEDLSDFSKIIKNSTTLCVNIRLRDEYWNTSQKRGADTEDSYNFFLILIRTRGFLDFQLEKFKTYLAEVGKGEVEVIVTLNVNEHRQRLLYSKQ